MIRAVVGYRMIARNLLGRLNARSADDLQRIAGHWLVSLPPGDRGRHVGALYRTMTDIRFVRSMWTRLDQDQRRIVSELAAGDALSLSTAEIAERSGISEESVHNAATLLFHAGLLSREGDAQELPVGTPPRLFLPREIGQVFRRLHDEIDAGDLSGNPLRVMLETLDDAELEEAATTWGLTVIPGQRRRADLVTQIMRQVASADRVAQVVKARSRDAHALWEVMREAAPAPVAVGDALWRAGLGPPKGSDRDRARVQSHIEHVLGELESSLLVFHIWRRDGTRWLFVAQEIAQPGEAAHTLPLRPLQPLPPDKAPLDRPAQPYAIAWDLLTVLRDIAENGAPVWVPGEFPARTWQRRLNRRLWGAGEEIPPRGYLGFLLYLGVSVDVLVPADTPLPVGTDKGAVRLTVGSTVRDWTRHGFEVQMQRLTDAWLDSDIWIEGREREDVEIWGADWRGFRRRLREAVQALDPGEWLLVEDLAARLAEQNTAIIGSSFSAATSRAPRQGMDERTATIAEVIQTEIETGLAWMGIVQLGVAQRGGEAVQRVGPAPAPVAEGPVISIGEGGLVTLHRPAPVHVWSLSAFADAESLKPHATYQLRPGSVARALGAGFGLEQIVAYLDTQSGGNVPAAVHTLLREWTVGYRRVRMNRALVLRADTAEATATLGKVLTNAGLTVVSTDSGLVVTVPPDDTTGNGEAIQAVLRANGYAGQWDRLASTRR